MAVTIDAATLATAIEADTAVATRLLPVASALVTKYAPAAPDAISNEAVVRCAAYLAEHPAAAIRREGIGDIDTSFAPANLSALRHSGASALLSSWRRRRGGIVR